MQGRTPSREGLALWRGDTRQTRCHAPAPQRPPPPRLSRQAAIAPRVAALIIESSHDAYSRDQRSWEPPFVRPTPTGRVVQRSPVACLGRSPTSSSFASLISRRLDVIDGVLPQHCASPISSEEGNASDERFEDVYYDEEEDVCPSPAMQRPQLPQRARLPDSAVPRLRQVAAQLDEDGSDEHPEEDDEVCFSPGLVRRGLSIMNISDQINATEEATYIDEPIRTPPLLRRGDFPSSLLNRREAASLPPIEERGDSSSFDDSSDGDDQSSCAMGEQGEQIDSPNVVFARDLQAQRQGKEVVVVHATPRQASVLPRRAGLACDAPSMHVSSFVRRHGWPKALERPNVRPTMESGSTGEVCHSAQPQPLSPARDAWRTRPFSHSLAHEDAV